MKSSKKPKISKLKRNNQKRNKLARQGKLKSQKHKNPKLKQTPKLQNHVNNQEDEESDGGEGMLEMIDKDDVEFLKSAITNRSYTILSHMRQKVPVRPQKRKADEEQNAETIEDTYEKKSVSDEPKRAKFLLPIKTKDGFIKRVAEDFADEEDSNAGENEVKNGTVKKDNDNEDKDEEDTPEYTVESEQMLHLNSNKSVTTADLLACREELLKKRKLHIGLLASGLLENPEEKIQNFKVLFNLLNENSEVKLTVQKLVLVSLLEIFKDIIPSYQIKHQDFEGVKLKKGTLRLQNYEKSLLKAYKTYLQYLEKFSSVLKRKMGAKRCTPQEQNIGELAVHCLADLLPQHPYFNFSQNLAQLLVSFLNHHMVNVRTEALKSLSNVLRNDKRGEISLHVVRRINHMVKKRGHAVHSDVLAVLLTLRIRDVNLDHEKEEEIKKKKFMTYKQKLIQMSKRERKKSKRLEELEKELLETKAEENKQVKHKFLTEITKTIFTIYFRVLKCAPTSKLLSITLEGLAKFAHCINLEFYHDLVNVIDHLMEERELGHREQLHCVQTVFTILSGQGEALNVDPIRFYTHLYKCLFLSRAGCTSKDISVALRAVEVAVLQRRRKMSQQRLLAFTKRLCTLATHQLHNGALGCLSAVRSLLSNAQFLDVLLDTDTAHGSGVYQPELPEPEYCGAGATVLRELPLLTRHYHPTVKQLAKTCLTVGNDAPQLPELAKFSPSQLTEHFDGSEMVFRPSIPVPKKVTPRASKGKELLFSDELSKYVEDVEATVKWDPAIFSTEFALT